MANKLSILLAQINPTVGDIPGNTDKIVNIIRTHQDNHDLIIFPELALTGYPPGDLLTRQAFHDAVTLACDDIINIVSNCHVILGHPYLVDTRCYNSASVIHQQQVLMMYHKQILPNYGVFDEKRYFSPGPTQSCIFNVKSHRFGLCICEDIWVEEPTAQLILQGIDTLISLNASPFDDTKQERREALAMRHAANQVNVIYVNLVGGQDSLVFDGQSFAVDKTTTICARGPAFKEALLPVLLNENMLSNDHLCSQLSREALIYQALVLGLRDYVHKNNFEHVLLGLSGGIDSALTLTIAVDALGPEHVHAVLLPSQYTASMSVDDALELATTLGVKHTTLSIEPSLETLLKTLSLTLGNSPKKIVTENLQARIRGTLLMAISNQENALLLSTSNKSESAVGYATLYGDMCGGFAVLKDVLKTTVYTLARYKNQHGTIIPERTITRPPTAELSPNQFDQDHLPDYDTLDAILKLYMEDRQSISAIVQKGFDKTTVQKVVSMLKRSEYKRGQTAPGPRVSHCAFDGDWRYPITSRFKN